MGMTIDESYKWLEYHKQGEVGKGAECIDVAIDTMRKYQKIVEIINDWKADTWTDGKSYDCMIQISEVAEDVNESL